MVFGHQENSRLVGFDRFLKSVPRKNIMIPTDASREDCYAYTGIRFERPS